MFLVCHVILTWWPYQDLFDSLSRVNSSGCTCLLNLVVISLMEIEILLFIYNFLHGGQGWQKNEKKKKNTGNCKALCVPRKRKNEQSLFENSHQPNNFLGFSLLLVFFFLSRTCNSPIGKNLFKVNNCYCILLAWTFKFYFLNLLSEGIPKNNPTKYLLNQILRTCFTDNFLSIILSPYL